MGCWAPQVGHIHCAPPIQVDTTFPKVSGRPEEKPWGSEDPAGTDELPPTPLPLEGTTCIGVRFGGGAHRTGWLGQDKFAGGLLAHCRDLVGRGKNQGTEGGRLGSEWQEELRQRAGRAARLCAQGRGLSPPLLESWTYECAALLTTINSPGGRARASAEGGAGPSRLRGTPAGPPLSGAA